MKLRTIERPAHLEDRRPQTVRPGKWGVVQKPELLEGLEDVVAGTLVEAKRPVDLGKGSSSGALALQVTKDLDSPGNGGYQGTPPTDACMQFG